MIETFTDQNFEAEVLGSKNLVLVDFWASWCGPCQIMTKIIEELAKDLGEETTLGKLNVDENPNTAQKYQVMSIPNIIVFKNGSVVSQTTGIQSKEALREILNKQLTK